MPVVTVDEVKEYLGLTDNTHTERIRNLIPVVQDDLITYLNNAFLDKYVQRESPTALLLYRDSSTNDYITDSESYFDDKGFLGDMDIYINQESNTNIGVYEIKTVAAGQLTLKSKGVFISQDPGSTLQNNDVGNIRISRINWPRGIKPIVAQMIWFLIDKPKQSDAQSERIDDYAIVFAGSNQYPERVIMGLNKYRMVRVR